MKYKSLLLLLGLIVLLAIYLKIIMVICPSDSGSDEYTDPEGGYAKITVAVYSPDPSGWYRYVSYYAERQYDGQRVIPVGSMTITECDVTCREYHPSGDFFTDFHDVYSEYGQRASSASIYGSSDFCVNPERFLITLSASADI